jgi:hypothetical protein
MNYTSVANIINSTSNMTYVVVNTRTTDSVDVTLPTPIAWTDNVYHELTQITGLSFGNINNIYVPLSGPDDARGYYDIVINETYDTAMYNIAYETGTLNDDIEFLRAYWDGYSNSVQTSSDYRLTYQAVLLSDGTFYIDVINYPTVDNTNYSYIDDYNYMGPWWYVTSQNRQFTIRQDGTDEYKPYTVTAGIIGPEPEPGPGPEPEPEPEAPMTKYLLGDDAKIYTVENNTLVEITGTISSTTFIDRGLDSLPSIASTIPHLKIYRWMNGTSTYAPLNILLSGIPTPRTVTCVADMSHESIKGITSIGCSYDGTVNIQYSYDGTTYTSKMSVTDFLAISPDTLYDGLGIENKIYFKFWLEDDTSALTNLVIRYKNTK